MLTDISPERNAVEQQFHVLDAVDRDARLADVAGDARMVAVVAAVGGEVEGDAEALLPGGEVAAVESVALLGGREAGILADGPRPPGVHRRIGPARVGRQAGIAAVDMGDVVGAVDGLERGSPRASRATGRAPFASLAASSSQSARASGPWSWRRSSAERVSMPINAPGLGLSMISVSTPPMSLGWRKNDRRPVRADARLARARARPWPRTQALRRVDVRHFEADMMLPAERDSSRGTSRSASPRRAARSARSGCWACRRSTPARPAPASRTARPCASAPISVAVQREAIARSTGSRRRHGSGGRVSLLDRHFGRHRIGDEAGFVRLVVEVGERRRVGRSSAQAMRGRSVTRVIAILPSAPLSSSPSASST